MNRSTGIILGVLMAFASSVAATGSTPPGLPWVTATKQSKIKTNPSSSAAADASLLLDASSAGAGECMIGVDTATDVCLIDAEGDAAAASMAVVGTSSAATISATTALTLEETGAGTDAITLQAPASITAPYTLELPPDAGGAGECLQNTGTPGVLDFGACAAGAGDITAVGSMTSGAVFADSSATGDCLGLTATCGSTSAANIVFTDTTVDTIGFMGARVGIGTTSPGIDSPGVGDALITMLGGSTTNDEGVIELATSAADADTAILGDVIFLSASTTDTEKRSAFIRGWQDGASANNRGGKISFHVQNNGSNTITEAQTIRQSGWIGFGDSAPAVPYEFHNTSASNANTMVAFRDDRTTSTTTPNYMVSFNRQNSDTAAWYLGNDGNDDGVLATNNATLRIGYDSGGTFNEVLRTDTAGLTTAAGDLAVNGGDITTTAATMNLIPSAATAINIGTTSSSAINVGDSTSYTAVSGFRAKVREVSGTATLDGNDKNVICDTSGGAATLTLPSAANTGQELTIARKGSDTNSCNISRAGSDTITLTGAGTGQTNINIGGGSVDSRTCFADGGTIWYCHVN